MNKKTKNPSNTRKKLSKMGKYAALTAVGTFMILNPKEAQASSAPPGPGWGGGKSSRNTWSKPSLSKPLTKRFEKLTFLVKNYFCYI